MMEPTRAQNEDVEIYQNPHKHVRFFTKEQGCNMQPWSFICNFNSLMAFVFFLLLSLPEK